MSSNTSKTILLLAANPKGTTPLRLDEEVREIEAGLQRALKREQFELVQKWAVRPRDIQRAMLDSKPSIVHFSGHGTGDEGLVFEDETGATKLVDGEALAELFKLFANQVECVVLNGCYSEVQASAIARHVNYVIGMNKEIGDRAAIEFAVGFYDALGAGRPVEFAHGFGCAAIRLSGIPEHLTPVLKEKPGNVLHLQAIYNRSTERLRVVIPMLKDGTGSDPVLTSGDTSRITMMTAVEGLAYGWLLKALSPMMKANQKIECLLPSPEQVSFIEGSATFLIGSPSTNEQIRSIIASWHNLGITTEATQDYSDIITYQREKYETQFVNGKRTRDFSFLRYYSKLFECLVCTGTSPFGAAGAVSMVVEPHGGQEVETIHRCINNRQSFVAIGTVKILSKTAWDFERVTKLEMLNDG